MAVEIIPVIDELKAEDIMPNYRFHLKGLPINEPVSEQQKEYLKAFIEENFEVIKQTMMSTTELSQRNAYSHGAKDMLALVYLWIDSLNIAEGVDADITE